MKRTGKAQEWSTSKDAGSRPEAPSSEGSASCANPIDADEILNRIRATTWDAEHDRETFSMSRPAALELLTRLSPATAAWTKEPKEPGWYWYRRPHGAPLLCYLQRALYRRLQFIAHGYDAAVYDVWPEGADFLGPIPVPEE